MSDKPQFPAASISAQPVNVPVRIVPRDAMFLTQHLADGSFDDAEFNVSAVVPGGSLLVRIRCGEDSAQYLVQMREFVETAIELWQAGVGINAEKDGE